MSPAKPAALTLVILAAFGLTGCAPAPSQDEIEERFAIEIAGTYGGDKDDPAVREFAKQLGSNAAEDCKSEDLWRMATSEVSDVKWDDDLQYIHAASCSVLYGDSVGAELHDEYARVVVDHAMSNE